MERSSLSTVADGRNREKSVFLFLFSSLHSPSVSLGTLWPLVCMANHTIVLIIASQLAPSKDIHNITCAHTDTHPFSHRCTHSYALTVSSLAVNQPQIYFVWGRKDPIAKPEHTLMSYLLEPSFMKTHTHTCTVTHTHAQTLAALFIPPNWEHQLCAHTQ